MNRKKFLFWKKDDTVEKVAYEIKKYEQIKTEVETAFKERFGEKVTDFVTVEAIDQPFTIFSCTFQMYDFFVIWLNYDRGHFGCSIITGELSGGSIETEQNFYDSLDMEKYLDEVQEEIESRIPDKFLINRGWK